MIFHDRNEFSTSQRSFVDYGMAVQEVMVNMVILMGKVAIRIGRGDDNGYAGIVCKGDTMGTRNSGNKIRIMFHRSTGSD